MKLLFDNFDLLAEAPNGIKKLREMILQFAVQGKLTEDWRKENKDVEPASVLLEKIKVEKVRLVREGKIRKQKPLEPINKNSIPFDLPNSWKWSHLANSGIIFNGNSLNSQQKQFYGKIKNDLPYVSTKHVGYGSLNINYTGEISIPKNEPKFKIAHSNSVLICSEGGSAGRKIGLINRNICFGNKLYANETFKGMISKYIFYLYQAPWFFEEFKKKMTGIIGGISINNFNNIAVPIPPSVEQKKIASKVDSLMSFCDDLEKKEEKRDKKIVKVNNASINSLLSSKEPEDFKTNWQRIISNFDLLYDKPENVKKLKEAILQLAVMGKLTEDWRRENEDIESASVLLEKIKVEKERLINEEMIKKQKPLEPIREDEVPFDIPKSWEWVRLGDIHDVTSSKRIYAKDYHSEGVPFFRSKEIGELGRGQKTSIELYISREYYNKLKNKMGFPYPGDFMLASIGGSIGNNWICDDREFYYKDGNITKIGKHKYVNMNYLKIYIEASLFWKQVIGGVAGSAYNALTIIKIKSLYFPLPPLKEQQCIVNKVDSLIELCSKIEKSLNKKHIKNEKIFNAFVNRINI